MEVWDSQTLRGTKVLRKKIKVSLKSQSKTPGEKEGSEVDGSTLKLYKSAQNLKAIDDKYYTKKIS